MKKIILFILITLFINTLKAQTIKIKEPEFAGSIVFVNDSIGDGLPLEFQTPTGKYSVFSSNFRYTLNGCCSSFTISQKKDIYFIVKTENNSTNPSIIIRINKLISEKKSRYITLKTNLEPEENNKINFTANKYGASSYLVKIPEIETGEYAIRLSIHYYSFQIK